MFHSLPGPCNFSMEVFLGGVHVRGEGLVFIA